MYIKNGTVKAPATVDKGFTIIELMVAMTIALVVSAATTSLAANVFQSNTQSIHLIQLTQELRSSIQLISRDIRRSGYTEDALARFLATETISSGVTMGPLDEENTANCLQVEYEDSDGNDVNVVYRRRVVSNIGRVSALFDAGADCTTSTNDTGWVDISDPLLTNITSLEYVLTDRETDVAENSSTGNVIKVGMEQISIVISSTLTGNNEISRTIINEVQLRNQYITV